MGLDLKLIPFYGEKFALAVLPLDRNYELFEALDPIKKGPVVPEGFRAFGVRESEIDEDASLIVRDPYGDPVRTTTAHDILRVVGRPYSIEEQPNAIDHLSPNTRGAP